MNHRVRKAARRGARVHALNPIDFDLNYDLASKLIAAPAALADEAVKLARAALELGGEAPSELAALLASATTDDAARALASSLKDASAAVIIFGEAAAMHPQASLLRACARFVALATDAGYNEVPLGANTLGLSRSGVVPASGGLDARTMLALPRKGYVLYGAEPPYDFGDGGLAMTSLAKADVVIAFSAFASDAIKAVATVILPIAALPETDATLVNLNGISQTVAAGAKPPGEARPGWKVLRALGGKLAVAGFDFSELAELRATLAAKTATIAPQVHAKVASRQEAKGLVRIATVPIYRSDAVVRRATALQAHPLNSGAGLGLNPLDAASSASTKAAWSRSPALPAPRPCRSSSVPPCRVALPGSRQPTARPQRCRPTAPNSASARHRRMDSLIALLNNFVVQWPTLSTFIGLILLPMLPLIISVAMYVWWERKVIGWMHVRMGPNQIGPLGLAQAFADVFKLLFKEITVPEKASSFLFYLAPLLALAPAMAAWAVVPIGDRLAWSNANAGLLYLLAMTSLGVYGILLAGWASNSKYAFLGAMRSAAQVVSYEIAMGMALVSVLILCGSLNLSDIVDAQAGSKGFLEWFLAAAAADVRRLFHLRRGRNQPRAVRRGRGRIGNRRRLPCRIFGLGLRDLLPGRIRQHDPGRVPGFDPVPRRLAVAGAGLGPGHTVGAGLVVAVRQGLSDGVSIPVVPRDVPALPL